MGLTLLLMSRVMLELWRCCCQLRRSANDCKSPLLCYLYNCVWMNCLLAFLCFIQFISCASAHQFRITIRLLSCLSCCSGKPLPSSPSKKWVALHGRIMYGHGFLVSSQCTPLSASCFGVGPREFDTQLAPPFAFA